MPCIFISVRFCQPHKRRHNLPPTFPYAHYAAALPTLVLANSCVGFYTFELIVTCINQTSAQPHCRMVRVSLRFQPSPYSAGAVLHCEDS